MIDLVGEETAGADKVLRMQKGSRRRLVAGDYRGLHFTTHLEEV